MSRTFRRKGYESTKGNSWNVGGRKINGYYTDWDYCVSTGNGHAGVKLYKPYSPQDYAKEYWRIHGESKHSNAWGPGKGYKTAENQRFRREGKHELHKELTIPDYEGIHTSHGKYPWDANYW